MSYTLFPQGESWLTGDESGDIKLTQELKRVFSDLNDEQIRQFSILAENVKPRINHQAYVQVINFVIKALIELKKPNAFINQEFVKYLGQFSNKLIVEVEDEDIKVFFKELLDKKRVRFKGEIDFSLEENSLYEFNPYIEYRLQKSKYSLNIRAIYKDLKLNLNNKFYKESDKILYLLQDQKKAYIVQNRFVFWCHEGQFYGLVLEV